MHELNAEDNKFFAASDFDHGTAAIVSNALGLRPPADFHEEAFHRG